MKFMTGRLTNDLRYGIRMLAKSPGFTLIAMLTLALGIGANAALFTVAHSILLRPLSYRDPDRLALISTLDPAVGTRGGMSYPRFVYISQHARAFSGIAAFFNEVFTFTDRGEPEQLAAARVSRDFFPVLGVNPVIGRSFTADEDTRGGRPVVMISYNFWTRRFARDPRAVGQTISLDSRPYTIVGVVPEDFHFGFIGATIDIWAPRVFDISIATPQQINGGAGYLQAVARLAPGVTWQQAQSQMDVLTKGYLADFPGMADASPKNKVAVDHLRDQLVANVRPTILILMGAVGLLLLIACANVAGLLLSRALGRRKEIAIRTALGASRGALIRQLLTESTLLAVCGGAVGVLLSDWGTRAMLPLVSAQLPRGAEIRTDATVLLFGFAVSVFTGILFGLVPALDVSRVDTNSGLREESRGATASRGKHRLRTVLVIAQVALSMVLLVSAGLLIRSFSNLLNVSPGLEPAHVLTMNILLPPAKYPPLPIFGTSKDARMVDFFNKLVQQAAQLPGVRSAALESALPVNPNRFAPTAFEGQPPIPFPQRPLVEVETATPAYFATVGARVLRGRVFNDHDNADSARVVIVNDMLARRYWPNANPIGKHIYLGSKNAASEVVGVVADIKNVTLAGPASPEMYFPYPQLPTRSMNLLLRTEGDPHALVSAARHLVASLDPDQPVTAVATLDELLASSRVGPRSTTWLLGLFSGMALVLAMVGIYGTISYSVLQRTSELGIRMALGADRRDIFAMVIRQGLLLAAVGVGAGIIASLAVTRLMSTLLFGVSAADPATFVGSALLFGTTAMLASYVPARRATLLDPTIALRT